MTTVLVTGASGFIGRRALPALVARGFDVHAVGASRTVAVDGVRWHTCDLLEPHARRTLVDGVRATHLLHLAWYAEPGAFWTSLRNVAWSSATLELVRDFREAGGERVAVAGTCAEYDWTHGWCSEGITPEKPGTLYGASKDGTRRILAAYAELSGLSMAWGRIFHLHGPDEDPRRLVRSVATALLRGEEARTSAGDQVRDFSHVEDVAAGLVALLASKAQGSVNVASGEPVRLRRIVEMIGESTGSTALLRMGALPARADEPPLLVADVRRLRSEVGFTPRYTLDEGIAATVAAIRNDLEGRP